MFGQLPAVKRALLCFLESPSSHFLNQNTLIPQTPQAIASVSELVLVVSFGESMVTVVTCSLVFVSY